MNAYTNSPIGALMLVEDQERLTEIRFCPETPNPRPGSTHPLLQEAIVQLEAYFAGNLRHFDLPLAPAGTPFQQTVWHELQCIPYGHTITYAELARRIGRPTASRAVGAANGRNPIPILIPCHRVIGSNGHLTGYAGGLPIKTHLLALEGHQLFA